MEYTANYRRNLTEYWQQYFPNWTIPVGYHVHHIKPKYEGGTHHPRNLIALHPDDHIAIHRCRGDHHFPVGKTINGNRGVDNPMYGRKHSEETKAKMSRIGLGKKVSAAGRKNISAGQVGLHKGEKNHMFGKKHSEETKRKISQKAKEQRWECEHCLKQGVGMANFVRWHGTNCKEIHH